ACAALGGRLFARRYALAARLYAEAFAADPGLADDVRAGHRYGAACAAVLAGCGQGEDAAVLDDGEWARLRDEGRAWLRADLTRYGEQLADADEGKRASVRRRLEHWQHNPDLAGVRDGAELAALAEAERRQWLELWQEAEAVLARSSAAREPGPGAGASAGGGGVSEAGRGAGAPRRAGWPPFRRAGGGQKRGAPRRA